MGKGKVHTCLHISRREMQLSGCTQRSTAFTAPKKQASLFPLRECKGKGVKPYCFLNKLSNNSLLNKNKSTVPFAYSPQNLRNHEHSPDSR